MKKVALFFICLSLLWVANAEELFCNDQFEYSLLPDGTVKVEDYLNRYSPYSYSTRKQVIVETLIIPDYVDGHLVTAISRSAFDEVPGLCEIVIPDSITMMEANPFGGNENLERIVVSSNNPVFEVVDGVLFNKVTHALVCYPYAFTDDFYAIPTGVVTIGEEAFQSTSVSNVYIPETVTTIGNSAFAGAGLERLSIPSSVMTIGEDAFAVSNLIEITIPDSIVAIEPGTFYNCHDLLSVSIPRSVVSIGESAFGRCDVLNVISIDDDHPIYMVQDNVIFDKMNKALISYPYSSINTEYRIPDWVEKIGPGAFDSCEELERVTIPDSVNTIDKHAFRYCTNLESLSIPATVQSIDYSSFEGCDGISLIVEKGSYAENYARTQGIDYSFS